MPIDRIKSLMKQQGLDACLVADNANMFYISGRVFRGYIYIDTLNDPIYFVIKPSGLEGGRWHYIRKPEMIPDELVKLGKQLPKKMGLEFDDITYSVATRLKGIFPDCELENASPLFKESRIVKTQTELELMRADGKHHVAVYSRIPSLYRPGMTDLQLQIEIERALRREGALGFLRVNGNLMEINMGSVLNGDNADVPVPYDFAMGGGGVNGSLPVGADGRVMKEGTTVMIDMNGNFNGYQTDLTRTWSIGAPSQQALDIHNLSIDICHRLQREALPGVPVAHLYDVALEVVKAHKVEHLFMGHRQQVSFIGHGVGIQLNELPVVMHKSRHTLQENMVLAIEPKFVLPGIGALGIENTYVVTPNGLENLTPAPESLEQLS